MSEQQVPFSEKPPPYSAQAPPQPQRKCNLMTVSVVVLQLCGYDFRVFYSSPWLSTLSGSISSASQWLRILVWSNNNHSSAPRNYHRWCLSRLSSNIHIPAASNAATKNLHFQVGYLEDDYTCLGILMAILFFPLGIICCLALKNRRCSNCGAYFG